MSNLNDDKLDRMLKAYCNREENFVFKKQPRHTIRNTAILAATLVLAFGAVFTISHFSADKNLFVLDANAATIDQSTATNMNTDDDIRTGVSGFIMFENEGIVHAKVRSEESKNGNAEFARFLDNNSAFDFQNEKIAIDYEVSPRLNLADASVFYYWDAENDWTSTQWIIYDNFGKCEDTIEVVLYYADGTYSVHYINVTFNGEDLHFELAE